MEANPYYLFRNEDADKMSYSMKYIVEEYRDFPYNE